MRLSIRSRRFKLSSALERYAKRRVEGMVGRFQDRVRSVEICMSDLNGPRGGIDKRCLVRVSGPHRLDVTIEERDSDMYNAIDRAIARAKHALVREMEKRTEIRDRSSIRAPAPSFA